MDYTIGRARRADLLAVPAIERAGARMLAPYLPADALDDVTPFDQLEVARQEHRLWMARNGDLPVGFALVQRLDGEVHLEEIDVLPEHGRRGIGRALVWTVCRWAAKRGCRFVTLTTFRDVPWNMPFYAQLGFEEVPEPEWTPGLRLRVRQEAAHGLKPESRAVMRILCSARRSARRPRLCHATDTELDS